MSEDRHLMYTILVVTILSVIYVVISIIMQVMFPTMHQLNGLFAVAGASLIFGSTGIPMKTQSLKDISIDPTVFSLFLGVGIFITGFPFLLYSLAIDEFVFINWSILGATDFAIIGIFAFMAIQELGVATAPSIWAGLGMICSFLWGLLFFEEESKNLAASVIAIGLLFFGVYCVGSSQSMNACIHAKESLQETEPGKANFISNPVYEMIPVLIPAAQEEGNSIEIGKIDDGNIGDVPKDAKETLVQGTMFQVMPASISQSAAENRQDISGSTDNGYAQLSVESGSSEMRRTAFIMAYVYATITGFLDGSLAVPFKLANVSAGGVALQYIPSFGLSALVVPAVVFALYNVIRGRQIALVANECKVAAFPGVSSGILWASANYLSVIATHYLGIEVGFPLTQTCLVFTAAWGILYFKEINLRKTGKTVRFTSGIVTIVIGAYLLGSSTKA